MGFVIGQSSRGQTVLEALEINHRLHRTGIELYCSGIVIHLMVHSIFLIILHSQKVDRLAESVRAFSGFTMREIGSNPSKH